MKNVVIIGGGFAGINLALKLADKPKTKVTLIDKNNYNFFAPLLYQVATGMLDVSSISVPIRTLFENKKNLHFRLGELKEILPQENKVILNNGEIKYDYLVIATGTTSNFFGMKNIEENALPMKTIDEAILLRNTLLKVAELATINKNKAEQVKLRNIVIAGAGPAGIEVAGMLAEMRNRSLKRIYPEFNEKQMHIYLIEGGNQVLSAMSDKARKYSRESLKKLGVIVKLNSFVTDYKDDTVFLKDGSSIPTKTLIWTSGVTAYKFKGIPEESYDRGNRIIVDEINKVQGTKNIFSIGDTCIQKTDEKYPNGHPQLGSVATQQGHALAKNITALINGKETTAFKYTDKGTMAIIGKNKAAADMIYPKRTYTGWLAWAVWLLVHLFLLINYRNRMKTIWNWTTSYFIRTQSEGLLIGKTKIMPIVNTK
ncbi:MAG: NAD(P)/FAD-dependent oxidoreductase [Bacteroidetes bacterium]|nr:NAD(P)/FAD-dependent oxidoreductase [Bacteroidota bacterium]MCB9226967.1 NAD(P)/FAD-dependent oxidoreductase [Chitinophagales bacterium]